MSKNPQQQAEPAPEPTPFEIWQRLKARSAVVAANFYNMNRSRIEASRPVGGLVDGVVGALEREGVADPGADFLDKAALQDKYHARFVKLFAERKDEIMARMAKAAPGLVDLAPRDDAPRQLARAHHQASLLRAAEREVAEQVNAEKQAEVKRLQREHFQQVAADQDAWDKQEAERRARELADAKAAEERSRILNMIGLG